ncbi:MAG: hypothetical protein HC842_07390 [Cytophagales bacterium]|nr:hypothetical protein [Cytophagales bacterium]
MDLSSGAQVTLNADYGQLSCTTSSGAQATLEGKTATLELSCSSGSAIQASALHSAQARLQASSGGKVYAGQVSQEVEIIGSSGGRLKYEGDPRVKGINLSSGAALVP